MSTEFLIIKEELKQYLKDNLRIVVDDECSMSDTDRRIDIKILLDRECITSEYFLIYNQ